MNVTLSQQEISINPPHLRDYVENNYKSSSLSRANLVDYRFELTKKEKRVFDYVTSFKKKEFIKLRRRTIAQACECSVKTVTRSLAKFDSDGVITKHRPFQQSPNILSLTPQLVRGAQAFQLWVNKLDDSNKEMVMRNGAYRNLKGEIVPILKQNVPTYTKREIEREYIFKTTITTKITYKRKTREGSREDISRRNIPSVSKNGVAVVGIRTKKEKERVMLNETSRNFIIRSQNNPRAREVLENPEIKAALFTPQMEEVSHSLKWDEGETLFLAAIPEEAIAHTFSIARRLMNGTIPITTPIEDSFNWFVGVSVKKCKELGLNIDRPFYNALCQIMQINPAVAGINPKPLLKQQKPRNEGGHSPMKEAPKMTDNERIGVLVKEIASYKEKIANPQNYLLSKVNVEETLEVGRALLAAREQELADLLSPPVKIMDKSESEMSPSEWLIWNRERKIRRLKAEGQL